MFSRIMPGVVGGAALAAMLLSSGAVAASRDLPTTATAVKPVGVGQKAPDAEVMNSQGEKVRLADVLSSRPTVLIFYRGGWCPYCNVHLGKLATVEKELAAAGYQVVAVSPDLPQYLRHTAGEQKVNYTLLSDPDVNAARVFGLAFEVDEETVKRYLTFKNPIDLEKRSGRTHHALPVPAAFVIDEAGTIRYAYSSPDYKTRVDEKELLEAAVESR